MTEASQLEPRQPCRWCGGAIPEGKRVDATTCSKPCRQAAHRFRVGVAPAEATDRPLRFAYADPPYPGLARRYYGPEAREVDHAELVARLCRDFPDGWALSTSARALPDVLRLCPAGARVCAWIRGARATKSRAALNAWEPLIVVGGRRRRLPVAEDLCDVLLWGGRQHSHPAALVGMKPAAFAEWLFRLLGARRGDGLTDLFPGSGAIGRAWAAYVSPLHRGYASRSDRADGSSPCPGDGSATAPSDAFREYFRDGSTRRPTSEPTRRASTGDRSRLAEAGGRLAEVLRESSGDD